MKQVKKDLQSVLKSLVALTKKVEKMQSQLNVPLPAKAPVAGPAKKAADRKPASVETAYQTFLSIINQSKKGVGINELKTKTGFNDKKIANLVYKAKKQGKIKSEQKGVYMST